MKKFLYFLLATAMLATFGCTGDENTYSVGSPNPNELMPKGTVQGKLLDACTKEPIVGAIIDIGVAQATTTETGQYTMHNVPATSYVSPTALGVVSGYSGTYSATIDLRKAKNVITGENKYPKFTYDQVSVAFSSLAETSLAKGGISTNITPADLGNVNVGNVDVDSVSASVSTTNATNHDTPVTQLGNGNFDFYVGKVNTSIAGYAVYPTLQAVPAGYIVKLYSMGRNWDENSSTGGNGHLLATTTVKANGKFQFEEKYEADQIFRVFITDIDGDVPNFRGIARRRTGCDGTTWFGSARDGQAVIVRNTDDVAPSILSMTVTDSKGSYSDDYVDVDPSTDIKVTFNFSEAIARTEKNDGQGLSASSINGLFKYIHVFYEGNKANFKAGNIARTIKWDSDTALTVTIPVGKASVYSVSLGQEAAALLKDKSGNPLKAGWNQRRGNQDFSFSYTDQATGAVVNDQAFFTDNMTHQQVIAGLSTLPLIAQRHFTTYGAAAAGQPNLTITNKNSIDYNSAANFSWNAVSGAKYYRLYCATNQVWGSTSNAHPTQLVQDNIMSTTTSYNPGGFVENLSIKLTYDCYVVGVDADGLEGKKSLELKVSDTVLPKIAGSTLAAAIQAKADTFTISFSEPMVKSEVQNPENYKLNAEAFTGTPLTIKSISYDEKAFVATIKLSGALEKIQMGAIGTGANGIAESDRGLVSTDDQPIPLGRGLANAVCVTAVQNHVVNTVAQGDDVQRIAVGQPANAGQVIIDAGADGICQTTAAAVTEVQNIAVGRGLANQIEITAGVGFTLQTAPAGDDKLTDAPVFITVATHDIAGNSLNSKNNAIRTDSVIE